MTDGTPAVLSKLAAVLGMDAAGMLAQSRRSFVAEQLAQSQQRSRQCSVAHQCCLRKYGMPLEAFLCALEALEAQPEEAATFHGVPLVEALADSRWWAHVQEDLGTETAKFAQLQALHK